MTGGGPRVRVGEALVEQGILTEDQLASALAQQRNSGQMLGEMLVEQGVLSNTVLVRALARCLNIKGCHLRHGLIDPAVFSLVGQDECERLKVIPMFKVRDTLTVAMAEPQSLPTIDRLRALTGCRIRPVLALEANIDEFVRKYAGGDVNVDAFLTSLAESDVELVEQIVGRFQTAGMKLVHRFEVVGLRRIGVGARRLQPRDGDDREKDEGQGADKGAGREVDRRQEARAVEEQHQKGRRDGHRPRRGQRRLEVVE